MPSINKTIGAVFVLTDVHPHHSANAIGAVNSLLVLTPSIFTVQKGTYDCPAIMTCLLKDFKRSHVHGAFIPTSKRGVFEAETWREHAEITAFDDDGARNPATAVVASSR